MTGKEGYVKTRTINARNVVRTILFYKSVGKGSIYELINLSGSL